MSTVICALAFARNINSQFMVNSPSGTTTWLLDQSCPVRQTGQIGASHYSTILLILEGSASILLGTALIRDLPCLAGTFFLSSMSEQLLTPVHTRT